MKKWQFNDILKALDLQSVDSEFEATGISIDTRTLKPGDLYIAIKGDTHDGHAFIQDAFDKGASGVIVSDSSNLAQTERTFFHVEDTLEALVQLGSYARQHSEAKIVAITGSVGKTTTKEWLKQVLEQFGKTVCSPASFNNQWGVPLSLTLLKDENKFGVFEIGMNQPGEIAPLSQIVNPNIAIITNIGEAHVGYLNSLDNIAHEKSQIFSGLKKEGIAILNADNPYFDMLCKAANEKGVRVILSVGRNQSATTRLENYQLTSDKKGSIIKAKIDGKNVTYTLPFVGEHFAFNSLIILTCIKALNLSIDEAVKYLEELMPLQGRGKIHSVKLSNNNMITLIDDAYNANPVSMRASLMNLKAMDKPLNTKRIAVIGEMLELGENSPQYHKDLVSTLIEAEIDLVFVAGVNAKPLYQALPAKIQGAFEEKAQDLIKHILPVLNHDDCVLIKGSKGSKVSQIVDYFLSYFLTSAA